MTSPTGQTRGPSPDLAPARVRPLAAAPITEALFDFRVELPPAFDPQAFAQLQPELRDAYPTMEVQNRIEGRFALDPATPAGGTPVVLPQQTRASLNGYLFRSSDNLTVAQFRRDGFTLNRLAPYTGWEALVPEVLRLWGLYRAIGRPSTIVRLAVRYLNRLTFPLAGAHLPAILVAPPPLPAGVTTSLEAFLTRVVIYNEELAASAIISQSSEPSPEEDDAVIILDIDAFRMPEGGVPFNEVPAALEALRALKNRAFFGSLTEQFVRRYD
jgi:uncharacterized protein (TIGR04255 family)